MKYFVNINLSDTGPKQSSSFNYPRNSDIKGWAHRFPQFEVWYVVDRNATGTYNLRNQNGSQLMGAVTNIAKYPAKLDPDDRVLVGFYDCNRKQPFLLAPGGAAVETPGVVVPEVSRYNWLSTYGRWDRHNSWGNSSDYGSGSGDFGSGTLGSGDEFDYDAAEPSFSDVPGGFYVEGDSYYFKRWENENRLTGVLQGRHLIVTIDDDSLSENNYTLDYATVIDEGLEDPYFIEVLSVSMFEGYFYTLVAYSAYEGSDLVHYLIKHQPQIIVDEGLPVASAILIWMNELYFTSDDYTRYIRDLQADVTIAAGRVCVFTNGPGELFSGGLIHYNLDGGDYQSEFFSVDFVGGFQVIEGKRDWRIFASGKYLVLNIASRVICYNLQTNTTVWNSEDTAAEYLLTPTHIFENTLLCGYEKGIYKTVYNTAMTTADWEPIEYSYPHVEFEEGLSLIAGVCAINLASGAITTETPFDGDEFNTVVDNGFYDYVATIPTVSYPIPDKADYPPPGNPPYHYQSGFHKAKLIRFHQLFQFPKSYIADTDDSDPDTDDWKNSLEDYDPDRVPLLDDDDARTYNSWIEQVTAELTYANYFDIYYDVSTYTDLTSSDVDWLEAQLAYFNGPWLESQIATGLAVEQSRENPEDIISADIVYIPNMDVRLKSSDGTDPFGEFGVTHRLDGLDIRNSNQLHGDDSYTEPTIVDQAVGFSLPDPRVDPTSVTPSDWGVLPTVSNELGYNGFIQWWETREEDPDPYEELQTQAYFAPSGNDPYEINRKIIWRHFNEDGESRKTIRPTIMLGPGCASKDVAVYGPWFDEFFSTDLQWQGWSKNGAHIWTDDYELGDAFVSVGSPVLVGNHVHTFVTYYDSPHNFTKLFIHNINSGARLAVIDLEPYFVEVEESSFEERYPEIYEVAFNGRKFYSLWSEDVFGPPD